MNLNKAFIIGRLTRDPERRQLPSGGSVVNFGMATNRYYTTQQGEKREDTEFHNIVVFGKMAETIATYSKKGSELYIEGRIQTRSWDDTTSGQKKYRTEVVAERMQLGARPSGASGGGGGFSPAPAFASSPAPQMPNPALQNKQQPMTTVSEEDIPVIQEETPEPTPKAQPEATEASSEPTNTANQVPNSPFEKPADEIDVKDIPF